MILPRILLAPLALASLLLALPAQAGPTVAADLDLGTSIKRDTPPAIDPTPVTGAPLYIVGFRIRAGWRFDVGPVFLLPELGGGYDVEHFASLGTVSVPLGVPRVFVGGRAGFSIPLAPALRFEPAIYGHLGDAWYVGASQSGLATDLGLALDLRIVGRVLVGAQVGYDVVTAWEHVPPGDMIGGAPTSSCVPTPSGCVSVGAAGTGAFALADRWVSYGAHAGVLFW
jgi:hypothetical protein